MPPPGRDEPAAGLIAAIAEGKLADPLAARSNSANTPSIWTTIRRSAQSAQRGRPGFATARAKRMPGQPSESPISVGFEAAEPGLQRMHGYLAGTK